MLGLSLLLFGLVIGVGTGAIAALQIDRLR